jgi:alkylation response protein AidB-like acyl-CoA dehydrogenase
MATVDDLLGAVSDIRPVLLEEAPKCEAERRVTPRAFQALREAGLFTLHAPKRFGGLEVHPTDMLRIWEAIGRIDSSIAWNAFMTHAGVPPFSAWLPEEGVRAVYADGVPTMAGVFAPPLKTERVDGGWRASGTSPFGSGCQNVDWLIIPMSHESRPVFAGFIRAKDGIVEDTWHTMGMRGTGSANFGANDVFVPDYLTADPAPLTNPAPGMGGPLFRMWPWVAILGEAIVAVASAASAVEAAIDHCKKKIPNYQQTVLQDQQLAQYFLGKAAALVEASRDTIHRAAETAYDDVANSGKTLSREAKIRLQLAASFAAEACAEATRHVNDAVGSSAIRQTQPFERYFRDTHTIIHHAANSNRRYVDAAKLMLGQETDWIFLIF